MLYTIIIIFALAAVFGIILAATIFRGKETSKVVVALHGLAAATALVLLIVEAYQSTAKLLTTAAIIFVIAALGGFYLLYRDLSKKAGPKGVVVLHALLAVTAFVIVLVYAIG